MGFDGAWGLAQFEGASRVPTTFVTARPEDPIVRILGLVWLLALVAFVLAAYLLLIGNPAWRMASLAAVVVSMIPVALWWENAPKGAVANALVLVAVVLAPRLEGVPA
jgi:hypothetical protein